MIKSLILLIVVTVCHKLSSCGKLATIQDDGGKDGFFWNCSELVVHKIISRLGKVTHLFTLFRLLI